MLKLPRTTDCKFNYGIDTAVHTGVNVAPSITDTGLFGVPTCTRPFLTFSKRNVSILRIFPEQVGMCAESVRVISWDRWYLKVTNTVAVLVAPSRQFDKVPSSSCHMVPQSKNIVRIEASSLLFLEIVLRYVLRMSLIDRQDKVPTTVCHSTRLSP